jgi:PEP-CTERM motif
MATNATRFGMKVALLMLSMVLTSSYAVAGPTGVVDDFSGNLNAYQDTRILNNGAHAPTNTYNWQITGGRLELNTTNYVGIEQFTLTRTDFSLAVGEELQADVFSTFGVGALQDIGLYVGAGQPTTDVRQNYVNVYLRNNGQVFTRGFDGVAELSLAGGATPAAISALFVRRSAVDVFELGYYEGVTKSILSTRTILGENAAGIGSSIGAYVDVRSLGVVGSLDNLRIIPPNVPGDVTGDGQITIEDFNVIKLNLFKTGQTRMQGDLTEDSIVDFADFRQWKTAAGPGFASVTLDGVPEPATMLLFSTGALLLVSLIRGSRRRA